jgi:peptidoglycan/LPS O-acetylase OafA/YrhL
MSVLAIIAFHTGLNSVPGGFYGVDAFFVLSGFLITSLLVKEWGGTGTIRLRRFWAGRARRLLPALFLLVAVIGIVLAVVPSLLQTPHLIGDALSTVFYASNWYSIQGGVTYFSLNAEPSPLLHTWSLAIEEQFYLIWPLVVLGVLNVGRRGARSRLRRHPSSGTSAIPVLGGGGLVRLAPAPDSSAAETRDPGWTRRRRLHVLFAVACFGSMGSALLMAVLAPAGYTTRAYYGTDSRAQALLIGAAISIGLTLWPDIASRSWFRRLAAIAGIVGVAGTALLWATTSEGSTFAFSGGFLLASLAAGGVVLGCAAAPRSLVVRLLELPPLPQWGRISYGVYLWYWPVLLVMTGSRLHWGVYPLFLARVGVTVAIAALSYDLIEMPVRRGALKEWRAWVAAPVGAAFAIAAVFVATLVPVGATELQGAAIAPSQETTTSTTDAPTTTLPPSTTVLPGASTTSSTAPPTTTTTRPKAPSYLTPAAPAVTAGATRPVKVLLVGDSIAGSLGVGLGKYADSHGIQMVNEGIPGCSLSMQTQIKVLFYTVAPDAPCDTNHNINSLFDTWRKWINTYNPDVVLYLARGETFDQQVGGQWENMGQPAFDRYVADRYRTAVSVLGARGAAVVLMTTPFYSSGTATNGSSWPEDDPTRVQIDNATMQAVAADPVGTSGGAGAGGAGGAGAATGVAAGGGKVYVFDLNKVVSPGKAYSPTVNGVNVRCTDGVHFSASGGIVVGLQLVPDLVAVGQAHATSAPGGAWAGRLPASTPPWYPNLPCQ